jgi:hypothetical protein
VGCYGASLETYWIFAYLALALYQTLASIMASAGECSHISFLISRNGPIRSRLFLDPIWVFFPIICALCLTSQAAVES